MNRSLFPMDGCQLQVSTLEICRPVGITLLSLPQADEPRDSDRTAGDPKFLEVFVGFELVFLIVFVVSSFQFVQ